jgi:delta 1-pyrroline-5-carboxylate dehydrogenase
MLLILKMYKELTMSVLDSEIKNQAITTWLSWDAIGIERRITLIAQWSELLKLQHSLGLLPAQMVDFHITHAVALISSGDELPGPTGESNVLSTSGRGPFIIMSEAGYPLPAYIALLSCALIAGNSVIVSSLPEHEDIFNTLQQVCDYAGIDNPIIRVSDNKALEGLISHSYIAGLGMVGSETEVIRFNQLLANRAGQIGLIVAETDAEALPTVRDQRLVLRFITEKTLTINVTAVGGNATLIALGCGEQ